mgnify:CR=1 FL=1
METNNYPNWLVSIEQAKKLKEIGFDKPTQNNTSDYVLESKRYKDENKLYSNEYVLKGLYNANETKEGISIPTWEQVFEWFREKGLYHSICFTDDLPHEVKFFEAEIRDKNADIICIISRLTYEEVREALLNKLIEIYEDNL